VISGLKLCNSLPTAILKKIFPKISADNRNQIIDGGLHQKDCCLRQLP
jgi:hypothetical protein